KLLYRFVAAACDLEAGFASRCLQARHVRSPPVDGTPDVADLGRVTVSQLGSLFFAPLAIVGPVLLLGLQFALLQTHLFRDLGAGESAAQGRGRHRGVDG